MKNVEQAAKIFFKTCHGLVLTYEITTNEKQICYK